MTKALELIGKRFGRLLVLSRDANSKQGFSRWLCKCDCGNSTVVTGTCLTQLKTKSCGCLQPEAAREKSFIHGGTVGREKKKTYSSFRGMKERCFNPKNSHFKYYGGRGITVCDRWLEKEGRGFLNFLEDMGERPDELTLDRKDHNGNYNPDNCVWSSISSQNFNIGIKKNNSSGRTGVKPSVNGKKWLAFIRYGKPIYLGTFDTFEEACSARAQAELKYYGKTKL